jgi:hypothetical protein
MTHTRRTVALCLATVLLAAPVAAPAPVCRPDALGNTVCRDTAPRPRPQDLEVPGADRETWPAEPARPAQEFVPAGRRSVLGDTLAPRPVTPASPRYGERPRPGGGPGICRPDHLGNLICR